MSNAKQQVDTPALALLVTGGLGVVMSLIGILNALLGGGFDPADLEGIPQDQIDTLMPFLEMMQSFGIVTSLLGLALSGFVVFGAMQMRNLEARGMAIGASIAAMLPCGPCCCIGLPIGIWALVVLGNDEVKAAFKS